MILVVFFGGSIIFILIVLCIITVTVATVIGTLVAFLLVPMRSLGQDSWKIASCLMGSYIGGGILLIKSNNKCLPIASRLKTISILGVYLQLIRLVNNSYL